MIWDYIKKRLKNTFIIILVITIGILFLMRTCNSDDIKRKIIKKIATQATVQLKSELLEKPSVFTHGVVKFDTVYVVQYEDPPPTTSVSGGIIETTGDISFEIEYGNTFRLLDWHTGSYYGVGRIIVPDSGRIDIQYPRIAFEPAISAGISLNGPGASFETFHINNILSLETALHAPVIYMEYNSTLYAGVGASVDIFPDYTNLRIGVAGIVNLDDIEDKRISGFVHVELVSF